MSWSINKSRPSSARFCVFCGSDKIRRDDFGHPSGNAVAFLCEICNGGFRVSQSPRVAHALRIFKEHREFRDGKAYDNVPEHIQKQWADAIERGEQTK